MNLSFRKKVLLNLVDQKPCIGKTAVMKIIFMLQQVKSVNMGYDFSIYTYGPYSSDVTEDVDALISYGLIKINPQQYGNYYGYELNITNNGISNIGYLGDGVKESTKDIIGFVKGKSAKNLELYSTIIYVDNLYRVNSWKMNSTSISEKVQEIKPHFRKDTINNAVRTLQAVNFIIS